MEAKKERVICTCGEEVEIDFSLANFSIQVTRLHGKTEESRTFFTTCPNCQQMHTVTSSDKMEWGNRKTPSAKKLLYSLGGGCLLFLLFMIVVFYFAGKGLLTVFDWLLG